MREIKFREYNKHWGKMYEPFTLIQAITAGGISDRYNQDSVFMQYTGLKDKNGKEIYEGDIVRGANCITDWEDEAPDMKIVAWNDEEAEFEFRNMKNEGHQSGYTFCKKNFEKIFEIIGNIYENPELLN